MGCVDLNNCIAWLPFDTSATKNILDWTTWTVESGTPTISNSHSVHGNALQLDGSSAIKTTCYLGGQDFTIDGWVYTDSSCVGGARVFNIEDSSGNTLVQLRHPYSGSGQWRLVSIGSGGIGGNLIAKDSNVNPSGKTMHFAVVYRYDAQTMTFYIDGTQKAQVTGVSKFTRQKFTVHVGCHKSTDSSPYYLTGTIDEFRIYDRSALSGPNLVLNQYENVSFTLDTSRVVATPSSFWRYINEGTANGLLVTGYTVPVDSTKSIFQTAFYQTSHNKCFDIPDTDEIWMKFDVFFDGSTRWRAFNNGESAGRECGISSYFYSGVSGSYLVYFSYDNIVRQIYGICRHNQRQPWLLHMVKGSSDGIIEAWTIDENDRPIYTGKFVGNVNSGNTLAKILLQSDGSGTLFSNVIISSHEIGLLDTAAHLIEFDLVRNVEKDIAVPVDAERLTTINVSVFIDTDRIISNAVGQAFTFATERIINITEELLADAQRILQRQCDLICDVQRCTQADVTVNFDTCLYDTISKSIQPDLEVIVAIETDFLTDTERDISSTYQFDVDAIRKLPYHLVINASTHDPIPLGRITSIFASNVTPLNVTQSNGLREEPGYLQSINIQILEQQITDRVAFVHTGNCEIMELIQGTYFDYNFSLRIEETTTQGALESAECCSDIDELLYSQIAYYVPPNKYEWAQDYLNQLQSARNNNPDDDIRAQPSTTIQGHLSAISENLGKTLIYRGRDWYSTNKTTENGGKTYASLISELIGWTSRLPHLEINCYIRDNTMYAIQRGYESNTVSLDGCNITVPSITKKIIRTTWGSDVWSKTTVMTGSHTWDEEELEPYTPEDESTGTSYSDEGLVEQTTEESETARTITTYMYGVDERTGGKVLQQEITEKYEKDALTGTWEHADTIVKTHRRVSPTQSYTVAKDADGDILGEGVSQNRFDDRPSPFVQSQNNSGNRGFVTVHDGQGNYFKLYRVSHCSEEVETGKKTVYGLSLIDTSFPVYGDDNLSYLTQQLIWLNRRTEETVTLDVYGLEHVIGFDDKISYNGNLYFLKSNTVTQTETIVNKQSLSFVRWY